MDEIPELLPASALKDTYRKPPNPKAFKNTISAAAWKHHAAWWIHQAKKVQTELEEGNIEISEENKRGLELYFTKIVAEVHDLQSVLKSFNRGKVGRVVESTSDLRVLIQSFDKKWRSSKQIAGQRAIGIQLWAAPPKDSGLEAFKSHIKTTATFRCQRAPSPALFQRRDTFLAIASWMDQGYFQGMYGQKRILWLHDAEGQIACGKSAVTHFVAQKCLELGEFSAGYVFGSNGAVDSAQELRRHLIATLASELAMRLDYGSVVNVLSIGCNNHCNPRFPGFFDWTLADQFQTILFPALNALVEDERQPLLIVFDDIHKCEPEALEDLFRMMKVSLAAKLPLHYLISGRETPWVTPWLKAGDGQGLTDYVRAVEVHPFIPPEDESEQTPSHSDPPPPPPSNFELPSSPPSHLEPPSPPPSDLEPPPSPPADLEPPTSSPPSVEENNTSTQVFGNFSFESLSLSEDDGNDFDPTATVGSSFSAWTTAHLGASSESIDELSAEAEVVLEVPDPSKLTDQERSEATTYLNAVDNVASGLLRFLRGKPNTSKKS